MVRAVSIIGSFYDRLYSQGAVKLLVNFILESKELIEKARLWDEGKEVDKYDRYGFPGYLRVAMREGINNPLVLEYMRRVFGQFREISQLCDEVEILKKHSPDFWDGFSSNYQRVLSEASEAQRTGCSSSLEDSFLAKHIPLEDIIRVLI